MAVHLGMPTAPATPVRYPLVWGGGDGLWVLEVGLACCAVEFLAATMPASSDGVDRVPDHLRGDLMVVSGTVTDKMAPAIKALYDQLPEPKYVVSFGSCANCGGPYWDSYCVTKGVDQIIPVDVFIPGCPPRPEALLDGLRQLSEQISAAASL